jgi:ketosteroid isomerase-like protein
MRASSAVSTHFCLPVPTGGKCSGRSEISTLCGDDGPNHPEGPMSKAVVRAVVDQLYAALHSRDPRQIGPLLADDVDWFIFGPADVLPFCGRYRGKTAVLDVLCRGIPKLLESEPFQHDYLLIDGDCVAVLNRITFRQRSTGRTITYRIAQFIRLRDGKVTEVRSLGDNLDMAEQLFARQLVAAY